MRQIYPPVLPAIQRFVTGRIVESSDPGDLGQDMLEVALPGGVIISAGWYPESSPQGRYRVVATQRLRQIVSPIYSKDADDAAQDVAALAAELYFARATTTETESTYSAPLRSPLASVA